MVDLGSELPAPSPSQQQDVVIWDGRCRFCYAQVRRLKWFDGGRLAFLSLHDPLTATLVPSLSFDDLMKEMWVVTPAGAQYGGADAIRYLSRRLPRLWFAAPLLHFPFSMPLWRGLYRWVAKRRYAIAGKHCDEDGTCHLHK